MDERTKYERLRAELLAAMTKVHELLPQTLDAAFEQGGRETAQKLADLALSFPGQPAEQKATRSGGQRPARGKVIGRINEDVSACSAEGLDETVYRQKLIDEGFNRSSVHMAIKRLIETGTIVQCDGRLYRNSNTPESSDEEPADAGERTSGPSSEQHQKEESYAAPITSAV